MKKIKFLFFALCASIFTLSAQNMAMPGSWGPGAKTLFDHVMVKGTDDGDGQVNLLPAKSDLALSAIKTPSGNILAIEGDSISVWIFIDEPWNFKGNLLGGKYACRLSQSQLNIITNQLGVMIGELAKTKPEPATSFLKANDQVSKRLALLMNKVKMAPFGMLECGNGSIITAIEHYYDPFVLRDVVSVTYYEKEDDIATDKGIDFKFFLEREWESGFINGRKVMPLDLEFLLQKAGL